MINWKKTLGAALLTLACAQSWATTLSVVSTPAATTPGSKISVAVSVSDVSNLAGYNFSLGFDANILKFTDYSAGNFLGSTGLDTDQGYAGLEPGLVSFAYGTLVSTFDGVSGTGGVLGYFTFETLAEGVSALTLSDVLLFQADADFTEIVADVVNGSVSVAAASGDVPEPASLALVGIGALAVGALRRRRGAVAA
jgi:hypothetical protein